MQSRSTDRYVTFKNIDCVGNSKRLMAMLREHIDDPEKTNVFWEKFKKNLRWLADRTKTMGAVSTNFS